MLKVWRNRLRHIDDFLQRGRATWRNIICRRLCVQRQQDHWQTNHSQHAAPLGRHVDRTAIWLTQSVCYTMFCIGRLYWSCEFVGQPFCKVHSNCAWRRNISFVWKIPLVILSRVMSRRGFTVVTLRVRRMGNAEIWPATTAEPLKRLSPNLACVITSWISFTKKKLGSIR